MMALKGSSRIIALVAAGALLAACGGGGASPSAPAVAATHASVPSQLQSVTIKIDIPGKTPAGVRRTKYVGAGTQSATVTVTPGAGVATPSPATSTANCTTSCTLTVSAYSGSNTFAVSLYDGTNASGNLLSGGSFTETIAKGTANSFNVTFNGVPVTAAAIPTAPTLPNGTPGTMSLMVNAFDADGNVITGTAAYSQSISLTSITPHVTLTPSTTATVTAPGQTITASYDGTAVVCDAPAALTATIGTSTTPAGGFGIDAGVLCGLNVTPPVLTVTALGPTGSVLVTDPGYSGTITISLDTCTGPGNATISPSSASGPSATFTITGLVATTPLFCMFTFSDGTNMTPLNLTVM